MATFLLAGPVHLDRQYALQGVFNSPNTEWTLPISDASMATTNIWIVLSDAFTSIADTAKTMHIGVTDTDLRPAISGDVVSVVGNFTDDIAIVGRSFTMSVELSKPYIRDRNGDADIDAWLSIQQIVTAHHVSGPYSLVRTYAGDSTSYTETFNPASTEVTDAVGILRAWFSGEAKDMTITINSTNSFPVTIPSVRYLADYERTLR